MHRRALSSHILMDVSELRIEQIRWSGTEDERKIVNRLFDSPASYRQWEGYHAGLMRMVGVDDSRQGQLQKMRRTRFQLIHRQALFEFLRESSVTGRERKILVDTLSGIKDYARAVVAEHARFLQSNSSLYCADHLSYSMMHDRPFCEGLADYHCSYLEYFGYYCGWILAETNGYEFLFRSHVRELKQELQVMQRQLLRLPAPKRPASH